MARRKSSINIDSEIEGQIRTLQAELIATTKVKLSYASLLETILEAGIQAKSFTRLDRGIRKSSINLNADLESRVRTSQAELITKTKEGWSYSAVVSSILKEGLKKFSSMPRVNQIGCDKL